LQKINNRNDFHVKIFVCEFVTGGGLYRDDLPASLAKEGALMRDAVLDGLLRLPKVEVFATRDYRLALAYELPSVSISPEQDVWAIWEQCITSADAVWPVAPESDDILARLCDMAVRHGKHLLASSPDAVRLAASKHATWKCLADAGIPVVDTFSLDQLHELDNGPCVIKPDDGISCEGSRIFADKQSLSDWMNSRAQGDACVLQPLIAGIPASISMLCMKGEAWVLSCNRQLIEQADGGFRYHGSILNDLQVYWDPFARLAQQVAQAMPGLAGYVGIDVIVGDNGIQVLEVNPRLTTSYAGLEQAIGRNPTELILDMFYNGGFSSSLLIERNIVEVRLDEQ
jgi:predicted ATP-grasp superfamily ATP-dependent carboligase